MMADTIFDQLQGLSTVNAGRLSIGAHATHIKLSHLSVEALRQAFVDFDSRIRLEGEHREERYPRLMGIAIEGGFLSGKPNPEVEGSGPFLLRFNPNLNTVIGGRGAGKSALLEAVRYVFDVPPRTDETARQADEIISATLPPGARITVFYELADGAQYKITRVKGGETEVYDMLTSERKSIHPSALLPSGSPLEVYGQKEIFEISKDVQFQLNLLDTYVDDALRDIRREESDLARWLEANAADTLRLEDEVAQARQRLQELEAVRVELERMERQEAIPRLERKKKAEREKSLLDTAERAVNDLLTSIERFRSDRDPLRSALPENLDVDNLPHAELMGRQSSLLSQMDDDCESTLRNLADGLRVVWESGHAERQTWLADYQATQHEYQELQRELGQDFSAERYFSLQTKLQTLAGIERELQRRQQRLDELRTERRERRHSLRYLRRTREFRVRAEKALQLTDALRGMVRVQLMREGNREAYRQKLNELLAGRRINREVFERLANARLPNLHSDSPGPYTDAIHLADAIRYERSNPDDNHSLLAAIYDISKAYRERLAGVEDDILYQLETYRIPDRPDIALQIGEEYRSLQPPLGQPGLSTGQKCTAILSIILVERDAPLVIDQPEDDLDNEFIFRQIVQTLRREKARRQFIVATHNANIPVTGDAELIVVMQANEKHGWVERVGSIDDPHMREPVENILEGGHKAFEMRQKKYETVVD